MLLADRIDLVGLVRPGDRIVCGHGTAEPLTLTRSLAAQAAALGPIEIYVGALFSDTFGFGGAPPPNVSFRSFGAMGRAAALWSSGRLDVVPIHYSALDAAFASGDLKADVVLLQVAPPSEGRSGLSLGHANDYVAQAARHARCVIAEVNPAVPWTHDAQLPEDIAFHALVAPRHPPVEIPSSPIGAAERAIAGHVAALVPDGATLQIGIGATPDAVLLGLSQHRDLGIHSGMIGDRVAELIEQGVITNARKSIDAGLTVTNAVFGTGRVRGLVDHNPAVRVRPTSYTHDRHVLGTIDSFIAVNSAVEVDLAGQVNAERAGENYVGGTGGLLDFARAARASRRGRAIIALPATARRGTISRIVPRLSSVTMPSSDADVVVTEHGAADLRGVDLAERARRMISIADPKFRDELAHSVDWRLDSA